MKEKVTTKEAFKMSVRAFKIYYKYFPKAVISSSLYQIITAISPYIGIYISAQLINELAGDRNSETIWRWVIISLISTAIIATVTAISLRWKNAENEGSWFFRDDIFRKKRMDMDFCVSDSQKIRDLRSQITQNTNWGGWGIGSVEYLFPKLIYGIFSIISAIALTISLFTSKVIDENLLFLNTPVAMILVLIIIVIVTIAAPIFSTKANSYITLISEDIKFGNRFFSFFGFNVHSKDRALDTRIYRQDIIIKDYNESVALFGVGSLFHKYSKGIMGILKGVSAAISTMLIGVIYVYVCLKALGGAFGIGSVTQYIAAILKFTTALGAILTTLGILKVNATFLKTSFDFLDTPNVMYRGSLTTEKRNDKKYDLEFKNVSFKYPDTEELVLKNVSLKFEVGEKLAVVGENGSGKTTFIKLLSRMYEPTEGAIFLNGIDISKYNYDDYISVFSIVFQDFKLLSYTLAHNVASSAHYDPKKVENSLIMAGFGDRLKELPNGIDTYIYSDIDKDGVEISGGEAQKIAIARAIYKDAPFMILDEPTAALDPLAEAEIYSKFDEIITNKTAVYISHRLSSCKFCDKIVVFDKGEIVETGRHDDLLKSNGKYKDLWQSQAQYYTNENV